MVHGKNWEPGSVSLHLGCDKVGKRYPNSSKNVSLIIM